MKGTIAVWAAVLILLASPTPVPSADRVVPPCAAAPCERPRPFAFRAPAEAAQVPRLEIVHWEQLQDVQVAGGDRRSVPPREDAALLPFAGTGGVRVIVSLPQQRAYVFRAGELVDSAPVSTGRRGHETPVGTFPIMEKQVHHRSNKYSNAPMPFMQRLTSSGIALHAGHLPGYRASHGCIRLPWAFAKKLYGLTSRGTPVVVTERRIQDLS